MNGRQYICGGCGRKGGVTLGVTHYECPVCRFVWEFPDMKRESVRRTLHQWMPAPRKAPEVRQPPARIIKRSECEKCGRRHPANWNCDARTRWKRRHQWVRFINSEYVRERLNR